MSFSYSYPCKESQKVKYISKNKYSKFTLGCLILDIWGFEWVPKLKTTILKAGKLLHLPAK